MDTKHFAQEIVGGLEDVCYAERRNPPERTINLHFDSPPRHHPRTVMGQLEQSRFKRMEHSAYSPDLALRDFFLFGCMKEQLKRSRFAEEEELSSVLSELMGEIQHRTILRVFADWNRRLRLCILMEGVKLERAVVFDWLGQTRPEGPGIKCSPCNHIVNDQSRPNPGHWTCQSIRPVFIPQYIQIEQTQRQGQTPVSYSTFWI
jgi:hypothetical protein